MTETQVDTTTLLGSKIIMYFRAGTAWTSIAHRPKILRIIENPTGVEIRLPSPHLTRLVVIGMYRHVQLIRR